MLGICSFGSVTHALLDLVFVCFGVKQSLQLLGVVCIVTGKHERSRHPDPPIGARDGGAALKTGGCALGGGRETVPHRAGCSHPGFYYTSKLMYSLETHPEQDAAYQSLYSVQRLYTIDTANWQLAAVEAHA